MDINMKFEKSNSIQCNNNFRELLGFLMYLSVCTRPDITFAVNQLSQFNNCYNDSHWMAAKRILRYLSKIMV